MWGSLDVLSVRVQTFWKKWCSKWLSGTIVAFFNVFNVLANYFCASRSRVFLKLCTIFWESFHLVRLGTILVAIGDGLVIPKMKEFGARFPGRLAQSEMLWDTHFLKIADAAVPPFGTAFSLHLWVLVPCSLPFFGSQTSSNQKRSHHCSVPKLGSQVAMTITRRDLHLAIYCHITNIGTLSIYPSFCAKLWDTDITTRPDQDRCIQCQPVSTEASNAAAHVHMGAIGGIICTVTVRNLEWCGSQNWLPVALLWILAILYEYYMNIIWILYEYHEYYMNIIWILYEYTAISAVSCKRPWGFAAPTSSNVQVATLIVGNVAWSWRFRSETVSFNLLAVEHFAQTLSSQKRNRRGKSCSLPVVPVSCDTAKVLRIVVTVLAGAALGSTTGWLICRRRNLSIGGKQDWVSALGCSPAVG